MSTFSTPSQTKSSSATPPPPPRPDGLTAEQALAQQQRILEDNYIDDTIEREPYTSPPVSPKTMSKRKTKRTKGPATSGISDSPSPPKKQKPVSKPTVASASSEKDMTPTRRSARNVEKKRKASNEVNEQESPLAKKSKVAPAKPIASSSKAVAANFHDDVDERDSTPTKKTAAPKASVISKRKGKAPPPAKAATPDIVAAPSKRPQSIGSQLRANKKLPMTHTPSVELSKKAGKKAKPIADDIEDDAETVVDDQVEDSETEKSKGKKPKKERTQIIPANFQGEITGMGTTSNKPEGAKLDKAWPCAKRDCNTGMTFFPRDATGSDGFGRHTISDFFGRNKGETRLIDNDVWHTYCRKDYQRLYYSATRSEDGAAAWHMMNLHAQFTRLKLWRPEATFKVQLTKNMYARSNEWHNVLRQNNGDVAAAKEQYPLSDKFRIKERAPTKKGEIALLKPEEAFPVELVDQFHKDTCGDNFDYDDIEAVLVQIQSLRDADTIKQMPPIEFLISKPQDGEKIADPKHNYERWAAIEDARNFKTPPGSGDEVEGEDDDDAESGGDEGDEVVRPFKLMPPTAVENAEGRDLLFPQFEAPTPPTPTAPFPAAPTPAESDNELVSDSESEAESENGDSDESGNDSDNDGAPPKQQSGFKLPPLSAPSASTSKPKPRSTLRAVNPGVRPSSSTYGATWGSGIKRARASAETNDDVEAGPSSKRQKQL